VCGEKGNGVAEIDSKISERHHDFTYLACAGFWFDAEKGGEQCCKLDLQLPD
jgi:hypothetical protein